MSWKHEIRDFNLILQVREVFPKEMMIKLSLGRINRK